MAIAQVGQDYNYQWGNYLMLGAPAGVADGHFLVAAQFCWQVPITPSGWILAWQETWLSGGRNRYLRVYTRIASSEPSNYFFETAAADEHAAFITAWSGVDATTPLDVAAVGQNTGDTASTSMTAPTMTTVTNGCEILFIGGAFDVNAGSQTVTAPSGYTELLDYGNQSTLAYLARFSQATAGATGAATATLSSSKRNAGIHLALRKAGGADVRDYMTTTRGYWGS